MQPRNTIQTFLAAFLLVLFSASLFPKALFHDALAHHTDGPVCTDDVKNSPHFHQPTFHCSFSDWVVTSPFLPAVQEIEVSRPVFFTQSVAVFRPLLFSSPFLLIEGRGPPQV